MADTILDRVFDVNEMEQNNWEILASVTEEQKAEIVEQLESAINKSEGSKDLIVLLNASGAKVLLPLIKQLEVGGDNTDVISNLKAAHNKWIDDNIPDSQMV